MRLGINAFDGAGQGILEVVQAAEQVLERTIHLHQFAEVRIDNTPGKSASDLFQTIEHTILRAFKVDAGAQKEIYAESGHCGTAMIVNDDAERACPLTKEKNAVRLPRF
jgi:hypothetical protein